METFIRNKVLIYFMPQETRLWEVKDKKLEEVSKEALDKFYKLCLFSV